MIVVYPDPVLRKKCRPVKAGDSELAKTIDLLKKGLADSEIGVGLAAPQVGRDQRVFLIRELGHSCDGDQCQCDQFRVFINPQIIDHFDQEKTYPMILRGDGKREPFLEGCLSFPNLYGTVKRWLKIRVSYQEVDETGALKDKEETLEDFKAIVFQHELDHLNGVLFIDHIKEERGKVYREENGRLKEIPLRDIL